MRAFVSLLSILACFASPLRAAVEFVGHSERPDGTTRFVLADPVEKTTSDWLLVGETWAGCTLAGFDPRTALLSVEGADGTARQLQPKGPRAAADPMAAAAGVRRRLQANTDAQRETLALLRKVIAEHRALSTRLAEIDAGSSPSHVLRPAASGPLARPQVAAELRATAARRNLVGDLFTALEAAGRFIELDQDESYPPFAEALRGIAELKQQLAPAKP